MKRIIVPIFMVSTMILLSSCSSDTSTDVNDNLTKPGDPETPDTPDTGSSTDYILHDALKTGVDIEFKLHSSEAVKWSIANGSAQAAATENAKKESVGKFALKPGKHTVTATFDNGTTISADVYMPDQIDYNIDLSENHTFISNGGKGSLYVYGNNDKGQLCLPQTVKEVVEPEVLYSNTNVSSVATGGSHSLFVKDLKVFGCGDNSKGQLGDGAAKDGVYPIENVSAMDLVKANSGTDIDQAKTKPVKNPDIQSILLGAGGNLSVVTVLDKRIVNDNDTGKQYEWKHASLYRFGGMGENVQKTPLFVFGYETNVPENNADVSVGDNFAIFKPYEYNLFSFGVNNNWQLGRADTPNKGSWGAGKYQQMIKLDPDYLIKEANNIQTKENKVNIEFGQLFTPYGQLIKKSPEDTTLLYFQSHPVSITASGKDFSLILSENKGWGSTTVDTVVYVVGGKSSSLGLTRDDNLDIIPRAFPIMTSNKNKIDTKDVLDQERTVYTNGQDIQITEVKAKQVAAGNQNGYILAEDGSLYAFGPNDKNQLTKSSTPNSVNKNIVKITAPEKVKFTDVWAGGNRVIVLGDDNNLYTWGEKIATPTKMFFKGSNQIIKTK